MPGGRENHIVKASTRPERARRWSPCDSSTPIRFKGCCATQGEFLEQGMEGPGIGIIRQLGMSRKSKPGVSIQHKDGLVASRYREQAVPKHTPPSCTLRLCRDGRRAVSRKKGRAAGPQCAHATQAVAGAGRLCGAKTCPRDPHQG